jgi:hypothetical protein
MAKNALKKLPGTLYVRWEYPDRDEPYLTTSEVPEDCLEGARDEQTAGVYELKEIVSIKSTVTVSAKRKA